MRLLLLLLMLWSLQTDGSSIRFLLRDEQGAGVAGATLTLRLQDGQLLDLTTDAQGLAQSGELPGAAVWLLRGRLADGRALIAESYPAGVGFRLVLLPGQGRDALLRLYGSALVLDPDMIFSPNEPGEPTVAPPPQLAAPAPPQPDPCASVAPAAVGSQQSAITPPATDCRLSTADQPAGDSYQPALASPTPPASATGRFAWLLWLSALAGLLLCVAALALGLLRRTRA